MQLDELIYGRWALADSRWTAAASRQTASRSVTAVYIIRRENIGISVKDHAEQGL